MKKSILPIICFFCINSNVYSQDLTSRKGEPYMPEAGDKAIGVDATIITNYLANMFGKSTAVTNSLSVSNYGLYNSIIGKKMVDAHTARRLIVKLGYRNDTYKNKVVQPLASSSTTQAFPNQNPMVEDKLKRSNSFFGLGIGMEKRLGKTRLQGIYGIDLFAWYSSSKDVYTYGNELTQGSAANPNIDPVTSSSSWSLTTGYDNLGTSISNYNNVSGYRITNKKLGSQIGLAIRPFVGIEYFFLPKISVGGEFGLAAGYAGTTKTNTTYEAEGKDAQGSEIKATIKDSKKNGGTFVFGTEKNTANGVNNSFSPNAVMRLTMYF